MRTRYLTGSQSEGVATNRFMGNFNFVDCHAGGALCYQAFAAIQLDTLLIQLATEPKAISNALAQQAVESQPAFYINKTATSFDLQKLCYLIFVDTEKGLFTSVQTGTIQLAGVKNDGGENVIHEMAYDFPIGTIPGRRVYTVINPEFVGLTRVNIQLISA